MLRYLLFLACVLYLAESADHTEFHNCSETEFCSTLRTPSEKSFTANLSDVTKSSDHVIVSISNEDSQKLNLLITIHPKNIARIKIREENSVRYELKDVLESEPENLELDVEQTENITVKPKSKNNSQKVVVERNPFNIKFYDNDKLVSTFIGNNLIFQQGSQAFAFKVQFNSASKLYGLHHHAMKKLELVDTIANQTDPLRLRNSDTAYYEVDSPMALYGSAPVVYGHSKTLTSGIFLHNAAEQWIDVTYNSTDNTASTYFIVERAALDLFVLLGNTPKDVVRQITALSGKAHMPQLWTLGYHQCRWSYKTQDEAKEVVANMSANRFPVDALWLDIDYTDSYKYFTWNPNNFADPKELQRNLSASNKKLVTILDPHIKVDEDYPVYAGAKGKYFVTNPNGTDFEGDCWPGRSSYLDFLNPEARNYYASWYAYDKFNGSTPTLAGVWNDMNEPSVFNDGEGFEKTLPFNSSHHGNVSHGDIHNIYGFLQTKATHQGLMQRDKNQTRPFILTRSHFVGSQRYAAMWTGDNTADWPYLQITYSECITSNLIGLVFCGADTGGFFGDPDEELAQRWYQAGIWLPFYRGHAHNESHYREPYRYNETVQDVIRTALTTRYKHIPVWYTQFFEHVRTGDPVIRPVFYDYPGSVDQDNHILLGENILATPIVEQGANSVKISFPGNADNYWYRVDDNSFQVYTGGSTLTISAKIETSPYFYRGGSIIARKDIERLSTTDMIEDPYILYVNLDSNLGATGKLYVDDFKSFDYQEKQHYLYMRFTYIPETHGLYIEEIDGDSTNITAIADIIIVHQKDGSKFSKTTYRTLADGTALKEVNIASILREKKKVHLEL